MADEYKVTVRIGAQLDSRSFDVTLGDAEKRAKKAAQAIGKATLLTEKQSDRERVAAARTAEREIAAENRRQLAEQRAAQRKFNQEWLADKKAAARAAAREARQLAQEEKKAAQEVERAQRQATRERERFARRTSYRSTRFLFPTPEGAFGYGRRVAHDVLRGVGMDWSLAAGLERNRSNEALATQISNQGWVPGEGGDFTKRISTGRIRENSQAIAAKYAFSEAEVSEGTQTYINLTGDLKGALPLMDKLALLSRATGTSLSDAAQAAADMSVQFEGLPDKGKRVADMLGIAAMQGKTGALELFQIAKQMPRIVSQAGFFQGDRSVSMANLLAATQIARRYGGAGTPAQSATVIQGVVAAIEKGDKHFGAAGVKIRNEKTGMLLELPEIIANSVKASFKGGKFDADKFFDMWNAIRGGKLAMGAMKVYNDAGGGDKGLQAIYGEFKKFTRGIQPEDLEKLAEAATDTQARRSQQFQQQMDKVAQNLQEELLPVLEQLEPELKKIAEAFASLVAFTAGHLPSAIMLAFTGAIARAGLESTGRMLLERAIVNPSEAFKLSLGSAGTAVGTFALAMGSATAALNLWDECQSKNAMKEAKQVEELDANYQQTIRAIDARKDLSPEEKKAAKREAAQAGLKRLDWIEKTNGVADWLPDWLQDQKHIQTRGAAKEMRREYGEAGAIGAPPPDERHRGRAALIGAAAGSLVMPGIGTAAGAQAGLTAEALAQAIVNAFTSVPNLPVRVTNAADIKATLPAGGPGVDGSGRTPPPGHRAP